MSVSWYWIVEREHVLNSKLHLLVAKNRTVEYESKTDIQIIQE